ncbi:MAG: hypothetical protein H6Q74_1755 [Firmicutes bacterium]|nr:hypothetical protein [Bacillota bacterium]
MTIYDVLDKLDKDLADCDEALKCSRRSKTVIHLVKVIERKKMLNKIKSYILANH